MDIKLELPLRVFRNKFLLNKICSYLHREKVENSFVETISMEQLLVNGKFEILYDKLISKSQVKITYESFQKFIDTSKSNPQFSATFELLWNQYNETIKALNPLGIIISTKDSDVELFKSIYNKYYDFNNSISNNGINQSYRIYDLLDQFFNSKNSINKEILQFILEQIKISNNSRNEYNNSGINRYELIESLNLRNKELLESIYLNKEIPLFLGHNIDGIKDNNSKEKLEIIRDYLKLDIEQEFKKKCNNSEFIINEFKYLDCKYNQNIQLNSFLMLYGQYEDKISLNFDSYIIQLGSLDYVKLFLLGRAQRNSLINFRNFKKYLLDNQSKVNSIQQLLQLVNDYKSTSALELYYYFDLHLIYHYLKQNDIQQIKYYLDSNINFNEFDRKSKTTSNEIKESIIYLLFHYSVTNFSSQVFQLFLNYSGSSGIDIIINYSKQIVYYEPVVLNDNNDQVITNYLNFINSISKDYLSSPIFVVEILKTIISNFNGSTLHALLNYSNFFKECYISLLSNYTSEMFYDHFESSQIEEGKLDYIKMDCYLNHVTLVNKFGSPRISLKKLEPHKKHVGNLLNHLFKYNSLGTYDYFYFVSKLHLDAQYQSVDDSINIFNSIDQELLEKRYYSLQLTGIIIPQYHFNKSSILVYNLLNSIERKDIVSINKILSTINSNNSNNNNNNYSINIKDNSLEIIGSLFSNGHLKLFDFDWILPSIITKFKPSKEFIFKVIPSEDTELKHYFENYYSESNLVVLKYHIEDYIKEENEIELEKQKNKKKYKNNPESNAFINYFLNGYYQRFLDILNNHKGDQEFIASLFDCADQKLIRALEDKVFTASFSTEWFKKLFVLINVYINNYSDLLSIVLNNGFGIFEFIWDNVIIQDVSRKNFILELFKFQFSSNDLKNLEYHSLMEYVLKEKKDYIRNLEFTENEIKIIYRVIFSFGNISIFKLVTNLFNNKYQFQLDSDLIYEFLFNAFNNSYFACDFIEYLYSNNYLNNLRDLLTLDILDKFILNNIIKFNYLRITKSTFILIHTIIKLQELN